MIDKFEDLTKPVLLREGSSITIKYNIPDAHNIPKDIENKMKAGKKKIDNLHQLEHINKLSKQFNDESDFNNYGHININIKQLNIIKHNKRIRNCHKQIIKQNQNKHITPEPKIYKSKLASERINRHGKGYSSDNSGDAFKKHQRNFKR